MASFCPEKVPFFKRVRSDNEVIICSRPIEGETVFNVLILQGTYLLEFGCTIDATTVLQPFCKQYSNTYRVDDRDVDSIDVPPRTMWTTSA